MFKDYHNRLNLALASLSVILLGCPTYPNLLRLYLSRATIQCNKYPSSEEELAMPIDIQTDTTNNLTVYEGIGHVEFIDIVEAMVKYYEGIGVDQTRNVIWDFSRQDTIPLTQYKTTKLADLTLMHSGKFGKVKTAVLPPKSVNYELWELLKSRLATPNRTLKICSGKIEAMEWLGIKK